jgi:hypothetical protein
MNTFVSFVDALLDLVPAVAFGAPLIAILVDAAKRVGLPDGYAPLASGLLNLILYGVLFFLKGREGEVQTIVEGLTALAPFILSLFVGLLATAGSHKKLLNIGVGYSNTSSSLRDFRRAAG